MANIRLDLPYEIFDGTQLSFYAPCDSSDVENLIIYYPKNGDIASHSFVFKDAQENTLINLDNMFSKDACVKAILSLTKSSAYIQNANTNKYIEGKMIEKVDKVISIPTGEVIIEFKNGIPTGSYTLFGVAYGDDLFVAVGGSTKGYICYSTDGKTWTSVTGINISEPLHDVIYANGMFVAVGGSSKGLRYYSTDGKTWTNGGSINTYYLRSITYANGLFVAVGVSGYTCYSTDGRTWTKGGTANAGLLKSVAYGNGLFVATGSNGKTCYSTDGKTWTEGGTAGDNTHNLQSITYANGLFVAVGVSGYTCYSTDGRTWTKGGTAGIDTLYGVAYGNGLFVAVGDGYTCYSKDGRTWTEGGIAGDNLQSITYANNKFIIVGNNTSTFTFYYEEIKEEKDLIETVINLHESVDEKIAYSDVVDNLLSESTNLPLSAKQGKLLQDQVTELNTKFPDLGNITISGIDYDANNSIYRRVGCIVAVSISVKPTNALEAGAVINFSGIPTPATDQDVCVVNYNNINSQIKIHASASGSTLAIAGNTLSAQSWLRCTFCYIASSAS